MGLTEFGGSESLDGLKFGQKIYFEDVGVGVPKPGQGRKCVVEGCRVDLSDAKGYYWRHKVCSMHSKTPKVIVAGLEQRFCQQCSRFHLLAEFDQGKRSCRRRLAGHNERRRKPPLFSSLYANSGRAGSFLMNFSAHPRLGRATLSDQNHITATGNYHFHHPCHANPDNASSHIFPLGVSDSSRALSLLSNQHSGSHNRTSGMNSLMNIGGVRVAMSQATAPHTAAVNHFPKASWGFKGNEVANSANGVLPDSGMGQNQFSGELELSQQGRRHHKELRHSKPYDSTQQMHWSL